MAVAWPQAVPLAALLACVQLRPRGGPAEAYNWERALAEVPGWEPRQLALMGTAGAPRRPRPASLLESSNQRVCSGGGPREGGRVLPIQGILGVSHCRMWGLGVPRSPLGYWCCLGTPPWRAAGRGTRTHIGTPRGHHEGAPGVVEGAAPGHTSSCLWSSTPSLLGMPQL